MNASGSRACCCCGFELWTRAFRLSGSSSAESSHQRSRTARTGNNGARGFAGALLFVSQVAVAAIPPADCDTDWQTAAIAQSFDYAADIQPIWTQFCANCHVDHGGAALAGLDLNPAFSYNNLVNAPDGSLSIYLVAPGEPSESLLWRKLNCNAPGPHAGAARMPLGRPVLTPILQALVYDWINAGAPANLQRIHAGGFEAR